MAKKEPTGYYDPTTGVLVSNTRKKKRIWPLVLFAVVIIVIIWANTMGGKNSEISEISQKDNGVSTQMDEEEEIDIPTEYTLSAGQYYAGIDIPCGKFNLTAISGDGNAITTNIYRGGVNGMFGGPGADRDLYKESYNGIKLPNGESLKIWGDLVVKIEYTKIDSGFSGRTEDSANIITLTQGNYEAGIDFPAGIYTIRAIEGNGNVSGNVYDGGLNEIMGVLGTDDSILNYIPEFRNALFKDGNELKIRNLTIELIPMIP